MANGDILLEVWAKDLRTRTPTYRGYVRNCKTGEVQCLNHKYTKYEAIADAIQLACAILVENKMIAVRTNGREHSIINDWDWSCSYIEFTGDIMGFRYEQSVTKPIDYNA